MQLAQCAQGFQDQIAAIAGVAGMQPEQVYQLWREYSHRCGLYDQSPVMFEFVSWYADQLGGNRLAIQEAVDAANVY